MPLERNEHVSQRCLQLRQSLPSDPQHLTRVDIEILMGQNISKAHDALPILLGKLILQGVACELVLLLHGFAQRKVLHADGIKEQPTRF
jgi:hypothetical protein